MGRKRKNRTNQRFGRLVALEIVGTKNRNIVWKCQCDCGNICFKLSAALNPNGTKSCGCLQKECREEGRAHKTHGMRYKSEYWIWCSMIQRCENPKHPAYKYYGGRGISVCNRWQKFENFYEDVGNRLKDKSLDRYPDNDGNYEPGNWRWATLEEQQSNSRPKSCGRGRQRWFYGHGPNGEMIIENSQNYTAKIFGLHHTAISQCLSGKYRQTKGWHFILLSEQT